MFELPELSVIAVQLGRSVSGKKIADGRLKNVAHRFVWHNADEDSFRARVRGKTFGAARVLGRWLCVDLEPGEVLVIGECGGAIRFGQPGEARPAAWHLFIEFEDSSFLWAKTGMWGAYELYAAGEELKRMYIADQKPAPGSPGFTPDYFRALVRALAGEGKRSAKSLLVQDQLIPGLGNAIAQDILFEAALSPKRSIGDLDEAEIDALYRAISGKVVEIAAAGGRNDERDLFGNPGGYRRIMDSAAAGSPCPRCGATVASGSYLGGAIYWCPGCQL